MSAKPVGFLCPIFYGLGRSLNYVRKSAFDEIILDQVEDINQSTEQVISDTCNLLNLIIIVSFEEIGALAELFISHSFTVDWWK